MNNVSSRANNLPMHEVSTPWFRQFWPWFIIVLLGSVVIASFGMLYIASYHADDLVVDDYYKSGLAINRELEKKQRAQARHITATLTVLPSGVNARFEGDVLVPELEMLLSHPLEADKDFRATLKRQENGIYTTALMREVKPRWHWTIQTSGSSGWRLDGVMSPADFPHDQNP